MTDGIRDWSFLRRPRWLAGHVVALVAIVIFVNMGLWQLRRLAERQEFNEILISRTSESPQPLREVLAANGPDLDQLELRSVAVTGTFVPGEEVILVSRSYNGWSGHHVLTPLDLGGGQAVLVDRGWVPVDLDQPGMAEFAPPAGTVQIEGVLRKTEVRGSFGPVIPSEGVLSQIARPNVARIDRQTSGDLLPVYVQMINQTPAQGELPIIVALPEPSEGPHRGYAIQWFLFTVVVIAGYPILLKRTAEDSSVTLGRGD